MRARQNSDASAARLIDTTTLCSYLSLGRRSAQEFAKKAGAERRFGKRLLYDKHVIDKALDELGG